MSRITLVVPAFNEKGNIEPFYRRCLEVESKSNHRFDWVFIDDGSTDGTFDEMKRIAGASGRGVYAISFSRNFGKEAGILAGLKTAAKIKNDYTVIIDADLQQDPEYAVKMANFLDQNEDYDCVACCQEGRREGAFMKFLKKRFYRMIDNASDTEFVEDASDFRMLRQEMVDAVLQLGEYHRFSKGIFSWVGFNTYYMPYTVAERLTGESSWTLRKLMSYAVDGIMGFSAVPLRLATLVGVITSAAALLFLIYNIIKVIAFGRDVPGYTTIVSLILIVGGIQMVLLGIMGEYISRIFIESKKRPIFIVKDYVGPADSKSETRTGEQADMKSEKRNKEQADLKSENKIAEPMDSDPDKQVGED